MGKRVMIALGLVAGTAFAGDAPKFLSYFELGREAGFRLLDARAEYLIAIENEQKETKILDIREKARAKGAATEDEYREALKTRDVSVARTRVWRDRISAWEGTLAHSKRNAEMAKHDIQTQSDLDALYADYVLQWNSQCSVFKSETELYQAEHALADYRVQNARKLAAKRIISQEELLEQELEFKATDERLKKSRELHSTCITGIPTLDDIREIAKPKPNPKP